MSSRNAFDSRTIIAHITEQQGPQRPREPVEFIPDTFIIQRSETQSGSRESRREALKRLRGSRTEAYGIHKKSLPPLDSLVRPEHILQLVSLPGPSKIQTFHEITKLWQTINSPITTEKDYERAVQKLSNVSSLVKSAIKQGDMERLAIQDFLQNLKLPVGPKACGVCLAPFGNGGKERETTKVEVLAPVSTFPILLPCCHVACYGCMTRWLTERSTCPSCDMRIENVDEIKKAMESRVRRYDDELAEVLDLLKSLASFMDRSNTSRWESADDSMDGKPNLGVLIPDTGKPFIDLRDIPTGRSFCEACGNLFSTTDNLAHYPVRLTCGDIFCYGDVDKWLNVYDLRNCPRCDSPLGDVPLARENIDSQIEHCRRALKMEERLFDLSYNAAALSLQQEDLASSGLSSTSAMDEKLGALSDKAAALQLYEWDDDSSSRGTSDEVLLENVVAALSFLDISPSQAAELDLNDLVDALAVLGLSPGNSATRLMGVLSTSAEYQENYYLDHVVSMVKLRLVVKRRSKAEETAHDLQKAAAYLQDTSLYLQRIAVFLEETSSVDTDSIISDTPEYLCYTPSAPDVEPIMPMTTELIPEDVEAALILTNMRTGKIYTSTELEAAVTLTMMQQSFSAGTGAILPESGSKSQGSISADSPTSKRVRRSGPARVTKLAPKTVPNQAKQNIILAYLQSSLTVHNIKDLEKTLPSVAGINGMQVKDFLQALSDEGQIRVEKIGSGNWYWSFASEAKKERTYTMAKLREEKEKVDASLGEMNAKVKEASALRGQDPDREGLIERRLMLEQEVEGLRKELEGYKDGDPGEVERRRKETKTYQVNAERWTDNIGILEGQMLNSMGGDREKLDGIKREVYGDEYVEEEGLREL